MQFRRIAGRAVLRAMLMCPPRRSTVRLSLD